MSRRSPRGDVLLEVLIALAVFAVGAALLLATAQEALAALARAERREQAIDLARSAVARLEAGIINLQDLRSGSAAGDEPGAWKDDAFEIDFRSERTEWSGLVLVELRVRDAEAPADAAALCTLRQLVRVGRDTEEGMDAEPSSTPSTPGTPGTPGSPGAPGAAGTPDAEDSEEPAP